MIRVAVRSEAYAVSTGSNTGDVGSNPGRTWIYLCGYFVFVLSLIQVEACRRVVSAPRSPTICIQGYRT
jgi:hypothetical protein